MTRNRTSPAGPRAGSTRWPPSCATPRAGTRWWPLLIRLPAPWRRPVGLARRATTGSTGGHYKP